MSYRLTKNINFLKIITRYMYSRIDDIPSRYHTIPDGEYQGDGAYVTN